MKKHLALAFIALVWLNMSGRTEAAGHKSASTTRAAANLSVDASSVCSAAVKYVVGDDVIEHGWAYMLQKDEPTLSGNDYWGTSASGLANETNAQQTDPSFLDPATGNYTNGA